MLNAVLSPQVPFKGLTPSAPGPFSPAGSCREMSGFRVAEGGLVARYGDTLLCSGRGMVKGFESLLFDGVQTLFLATYDGSQTKVEKSVDAGTNWVEITGNASNDPFGVTRFSGQVEVCFAVVRDRARNGIDETDLLVISAETEASRIYGKCKEARSPFVLNTYYCAIFEDLQTPSETAYLDVNFGTAFDPTGGISNSGTGFTLSSALLLQADEDAADDDTATLTHGIGGSGHIVLQDGRQLILSVGESSGLPMLPKLKIEVGDGTNWLAVLEAGEIYSKQAVLFLTDADSAGYRIAQVGLTVTDDGTIDLTNIDRVRFTWKGGTVYRTIYFEAEAYDVATDNTIQRTDANWSSNQWAGYWVRIVSDTTTPSSIGQQRRIVGNDKDTLTIAPNWDVDPSGESHFEIVDPPYSMQLYSIQESGAYLGESTFAISFGATQSRSEGPRRVISTTKSTLGWGEYGSPDVSPTVTGEFFYDYRIDFDEPAPGTVDKLRVYQNYLGNQDDFFYVASQRLSDWNSGTHSWDAANLNQWFYSGQEQDLGTTPPQDSVLTLPMARTLATANARLFLGAGERLFFSEYENPLRVSKIVDFDSDGNPVTESSGSLGFDGETVEAILPVGMLTTGSESLGSPLAGSQSIFVLTNRAFRSLSGWDSLSLSKPTILAAEGTCAHRSACPGRGSVYFLSNNRQVLKWDGSGLTDLTRRVVDVLTKAVSADSIGNASAFYNDGKYYVAFGDDANSTCLIWDERYQQWVSDDLPFDAAYTSVHHSGGLAWTLSASSDGVVRYEDPDSDSDLNGDMVECSAEFSETRLPDRTKSLALKRMLLLSDKSEGGAILTAISVGNRAEQHESQDVSLLSDGDYVERMSRGYGVFGGAVASRIEAKVEPGWNLFGIWQELETRQGNPLA